MMRRSSLPGLPETKRDRRLHSEADALLRADYAAALIAENAGTKVIFEIPDAVEAQGYSKATKARLDGSKLKALGWHPAYDLRSGIRRTMDILRQD